MIDLYLWEYLIAVHDNKTLTLAAKALNISQPALTKSMMKLEDELEVSLFKRTKNHIELNETGKLAALKAKDIIALQNKAIIDIKQYDLNNNSFIIGSTNYLPNAIAVEVAKEMFPHKHIHSIIEPNHETLLHNLFLGNYSLIITHQKPDLKGVYYKKIGEEKLYINVPKDHRLAMKSSASFADLENENILLFNNLGNWETIVKEKIQNPHFIVVDNFDTMRSLINTNEFIYFTTNLAHDSSLASQGIPLIDDNARQEFYALTLIANEEINRPFIKEMTKRLTSD